LPYGFVVEEDAKLVRSLNARYGDAAPDGGLETADWEALREILGKHFTGRPWPRPGDMDAARRFMADLQRTMTRAKWSVEFFAIV
jgi:hypothetical protein